MDELSLIYGIVFKASFRLHLFVKKIYEIWLDSKKNVVRRFGLSLSKFGCRRHFPVPR